MRIDPHGGDALIDAMTFTSHGGWGSEYDPMDSRRFLRITICDQCVEAAAKQGNVLEGTRIPQPVKVTYERWNQQ